MAGDDKALVEAARENKCPENMGCNPQAKVCQCAIIDDLTDRIEALSKENDRLNANLAVEAKFVDKLSAENERLRDVLEGIVRESSDTWAKRDARAALGEK